MRKYKGMTPVMTTRHEFVFWDMTGWILTIYLLIFCVHIVGLTENYYLKVGFRKVNGGLTLTTLVRNQHHSRSRLSQTRKIDILVLQEKIAHAQDACASKEVEATSILCAAMHSFHHKNQK